MKVVILCGGYGTRIRDVADNIPKPMINIGGYPILWHIMKYYAAWRHKDFVLCLGYRGQTIKDFFLNYEAHTRDFTIDFSKGSRAVTYLDGHGNDFDWEVTLAETGRDSMTGARLRRIHKYVHGTGDFMVTYGDGVSDIDLDALLRFHRSHGKILTVSGVRPPGRFGELMADPSGAVTEFNEKPQASGGRVSGGFFVCREEIFKYLPDRQDLVFEMEPMRRLVAERQMMVYEHDGFWQPMDTYRDYVYLNGLAENRQAPWMIWEGAGVAAISR